MTRNVIRNRSDDEDEDEDEKDCSLGFGERGRKIAVVAPREFFEAEIEVFVEFVEGNSHVKTKLGGSQTAAARFLHDRQAVDIKPADRIGVDRLNDALFLGFEAGA